MSKTITEQLTAEVAQLRKENLALYKRARYLHSTVDKDDARSLESKYAQVYESLVDPFAQWEFREKLAATGRLDLPDRFILCFLECCVPSRICRLFLCAYIFAVHAMVAFYAQSLVSKGLLGGTGTGPSY